MFSVFFESEDILSAEAVSSKMIRHDLQVDGTYLYVAKPR